MATEAENKVQEQAKDKEVAAEKEKQEEKTEEKEPLKDEVKENSDKEKKDVEATPPAEIQPPKPTVRKPNYEKDVVYLYQFSRTPVVPSLSPYCLKVETWLRLAGLKYEVSVKNNI